MVVFYFYWDGWFGFFLKVFFFKYEVVGKVMDWYRDSVVVWG